MPTVMPQRSPEGPIALASGTTRGRDNRAALKRLVDAARALLAGAIACARRQGATLLEAYPVDRPGRSSDDGMWFGAKSMYDRAGFEEVARRKPQRRVVRLGSSS